MDKKLIIILGPTASGKTALSLELADHLLDKHNLVSEIISADSRQIYKGMNIGTAKLSKAERKRHPHYFIDMFAPTKQYSAEAFAQDAQLKIAHIHAKNHLPIIVGGTGTYVMGLVGGDYLQSSAATSTNYQSLMLVPAYNRPELYRKIEQNVDTMFMSGLYNEVKNLISTSHAVPKQVGKTVGYKEFIEYAKQHNKNVFRLSEADVGKIKHRVKANTKKYAMHQDAGEK